MANHALGRAYRNLSEQICDGFAFSGIIERCRGAVGIDIIHLARIATGTSDRLLHRSTGSTSRWIRLREMMVIGRNAVTDYLGEDFSATVLRGFEIFQSKQGCAFTKHHAGPVTIERPAFFRRRGLKRIESDKD